MYSDERPASGQRIGVNAEHWHNHYTSRGNQQTVGGGLPAMLFLKQV
ncbi:hypothetical protein SAMN05216593_1281, partial [Pseudomonas asturiensis]